MAIFISFSINFAQQSLLNRSDIPEKYKWDLTKIYASEEDWEKDFATLKRKKDEYIKFKNIFLANADNFYKYLLFDEENKIKLEKLNLYASLDKDLDLSDTKKAERFDRIQTLASEIYQESSFFEPMLLQTDKKIIDSYIAQKEELNIYKLYIDDIYRQKEHTLSENEEKILASAVPLMDAPYDIFSVLTDSELEFPIIEDENGNKITLSHGRFYSALYSKNREYRQRAYKGYYLPFMKYKNTYAALFNSNLKTKIFNAKNRKYNSPLEAALSKNNIPVEVYYNLIKSVNENLAPLQRWMALRKKIMLLSDFRIYDTYVNLNIVDDRKFEYEEACGLVIEAFRPLGHDYVDKVKYAINNRYIDVYETKNKRSGAYSSGSSYRMHPYILLNWNNNLEDVFTLAHELGHNMHSLYSGSYQPFVYSDYTIFLAEIASTFNEALLMEYMLSTVKDKKFKLALIERYISNIVFTFYRQALFAEFEMIVYQKAQEGEYLSSEKLCKIYRELLSRYWGPDVIIDEEETYTWARVPHFYYNFYVYQYATGIAASQFFISKLKKEKSSFADLYINKFLKAGSSKYSLEILNDLGLDFSKPDAIIALALRMNELIDEYEKLLKD